MNWGRESWVKYYKSPTTVETRMRMQGRLLYPMVLRLAAAHKGTIELRRPGERVDRQLFNAIGGRGGHCDRLISHGLDDLVAARAVTHTAEGLHVVGWAEAQSKRVGRRDSWPFFRLYTRESDAFSQLSYGARALSVNLLRMVGDTGRLHYISDPLDYVVMRLGGWRDDGRWLLRTGLVRSWLDELIADGYLVEGVDERSPYVAIRNFLRAQVIEDEVEMARPRPPRASSSTPVITPEPPSEVASAWREPGVSVARPWREPGASLAPSGREESPKQAELFMVECVDRSDRIDRSEHKAQPGCAGGDGQAVSEPGPEGSEGVAEETAPSIAVAAHAAIRRGGKSEVEYHPDFERMWHAYPARDGHRGPKPAAQKAFMSAARSRGGPKAFADRILADIELRCRVVPTWRKGYPPDARTYLNRGDWLEPIEDPAARERERLERAEAAMAAKAAREPTRAERIERVALERTDWCLPEGPDRDHVWATVYQVSTDPVTNAIWDGVIRLRLRELAKAGYAREHLPRWAREFLAAHPKDWRDAPAKAEPTEPVPIRAAEAPAPPGDAVAALAAGPAPESPEAQRRAYRRLMGELSAHTRMPEEHQPDLNEALKRWSAKSSTAGGTTR